MVRLECSEYEFGRCAAGNDHEHAETSELQMTNTGSDYEELLLTSLNEAKHARRRSGIDLAGNRTGPLPVGTNVIIAGRGPHVWITANSVIRVQARLHLSLRWKRKHL